MPEMQTPGIGSRIAIAFKSFFRALGSGSVAGQFNAVLQGKPSEQPESVKPVQPQLHPLQLLAILQREGRLIDFLMEEIQGLPDAQIGAAVREVHSKCARALKEHVPFEPVVTTLEDETMTVATGYDPSAIRVVGNLGANPPYTGTVRHRGWKATAIRLQALPPSQDPLIVAPAEIEVN